MTVLNKHHGNIPADAVYIGRGSVYGNPFVIGKDGNRDEVIEKFEQTLKQAITEGFVGQEFLAELHGKDLVCFCAPQACHGHVLERYAELAHTFLANQMPLTP